MGQRKFETTRFALFTKSYAGYYFAQYITASKDPDALMKRLAKILLFKESSLKYFLSSKGSHREFNKIIKEVVEDKSKIRVYLKIEKQLVLLIQDKNDKESYVSEEYEKALLSPAIERVAGDSVANVRSDTRFETELLERRRIYNHWYYSVAYKYKLPTLRIIPFLSRLIKIQDGKNYNTK
jgi:glycerol-3-phosphate cytidylyltransferase-like family protein